jgi:SAM-dependent methyltransferase
MSTDSSYEYSAKYYDSVYRKVPTLGPDIAFYHGLAVECGGPVLELGCGTGRVLLPIASRGIACTGVDKSPAMLERFRAKAGSEGVALRCSPMESFDLDGLRYRMIFSAFRAFQHLNTIEQQLSCLARVRAHLEPGGIFAFDVFNPRLEAMALDNEPESLDSEFELDGQAVKRFATVSRDRVTQTISVTMRYVEEIDGRSAKETKVQFSMRWFWRYELENLMHRAGFSDVVIFGDFDRSPIARNTPAFVVVGRSSEPGRTGKYE